MKIIKSVAVKQIVTRKSKQELIDKFRGDIFQMRKECEQLRFELRRLERERRFDKQMLRQKFEGQIENRLEKCKLLDQKLDQLELMPVGTELQDGEVEIIIDLQVGDDWNEKMGQSAIVIKDGIIHEIR